MKLKPSSLTLRLFLCVSALNVVTMIVMGLLSLRSSNLNISEDYDAQLITEASILWEILEEGSKDGSIGTFKEEGFDVEDTLPLLGRMEKDSMLDYAQWRAFRVWKGSNIAMHSDNTENFPPQPLPPGLTNVTIGRDVWRAFSLHDPKNDIIVTTFENLHNRDILQRDILLDVLTPLLVMLPLLAILFSLGVGYGLRELRHLANRLATRSSSDLSRLAADDIPKELRPLVLAVNTLLGKLEGALAHEREFIDHAAHELRTPLSALKLQAQMLAGSLKDPKPQACLDELLASVDRTSRLVDQLLLLSRVAQQEIMLERVNVHEAVKETIGIYAVRIVDKHIALVLHSDEGLYIEAQPELLRILIGAILDNAIKYTPAYGEIVVTVERRDDHARVAITDSGEGIPEEERGRVFDRFYRMSHTKQSGSGLGLAIASQIAGQLHAAITLETPSSGKGLRVVIDFPAK